MAKRRTSLFGALAMSMLAGSALSTGDDKFTLHISPEASVELHAEWGEIQSMVYKMHEKSTLLQDLEPAEPVVTHAGSVLTGFLPITPVSVGDSWKVDERTAVAILAQFHNSATTTLHHGVGNDGAWATLVGISDSHAEILVRIHAEYKLGSVNEMDAWYTPAQFEGRLIIERQSGMVDAFALELPKTSPNVDVNIPFEHDGKWYHAADIGTVDVMRLSTEAPLGAIEFNTRIGIDDARDILAERFYPCAAVDWVTPEEALEIAERTGKPIHVVSLFGALEDESCCGSGKTLRKFALSRPDVVDRLQRSFVNVWLIGQDLPKLAAEATDPKLKRFYTILNENYKYPVDSVVLTPDAEFVAHINVKDVIPLGDTAYTAFLLDTINELNLDE